jgi:predicted helicase
MSISRINQYYIELERLKQRDNKNELSIKSAFRSLISFYCRPKDLEIIEEQTLLESRKAPDGVLKDAAGFIYGYWEAKDEKDDIDAEIIKKQRIGYPMFNFLIENSIEAVLIQGEKRTKIKMSDREDLHHLLIEFVNFETVENKVFKQTIKKFQEDLPQIIEVLRGMIIKESDTNALFIAEKSNFFYLCKDAINPAIKISDIDEMLIQHILTEQIFKSIFDDEMFHSENNISKSLNAIETTFFVSDTKRKTLSSLQPYYTQIKARATAMQDHNQKQDFLKYIYENFYKAYNPKAADKLGIVYTPKEIIKFMLESTDVLLEKHFSKTIADKNVHIIDPATGTGTFITDLLNYIPLQDLEYKYKNEIHANEIAILPYYIANLNIEYVYKNRTKNYEEFKNICWVDTLETYGFWSKGQQTIKHGLTAVNTERIKAQNTQRISVVIGNPPYNANQQNENDNNKNREYFEDYKKKTGGIDGRIKETYIDKSEAQKTKQYDMYKRFIRWASDRIDEKGIIAYITNRSFIDKRQDDGFRKCVSEEFDELYIIDLGGDIRDTNENSKANVFGIMTGVAITLFVKKELKNKEDKRKCKIFYTKIAGETAKEKLDLLREKELQSLSFEIIRPDKKGNWLNKTDNDFYELLPLADKKVKLNAEGAAFDKAVFKLFSLGVVTNRDEWVYDFDKENLLKKLDFFQKTYHEYQEKFKMEGAEQIWAEYESVRKKKNPDAKPPKIIDEPSIWTEQIKWTRDVKKQFLDNQKLKINKSKIIKILYRPFVKKNLYFSQNLNEMQYQMPRIFGKNGKSKNKIIAFVNSASLKSFHCIASNKIVDLHFTGDTNCLPLHIYTENGEKQENITDWALAYFRYYYEQRSLGVSVADLGFSVVSAHITKNYATLSPLTPEGGTDKNTSKITPSGTGGLICKEDIFHYVYAVLHSPAYRQQYEQNLKQDFPRIPLYDNFDFWVEKGRVLMELHINYDMPQKITSFEKDVIFTPLLQRKDINLEVFKAQKQGKKVLGKDLLVKETKLFEEKEVDYFKILPILKLKGNVIEIDELTTLSGVPAEALEYMLGNRNAIEWILDQYKPYKSDDKVIQEQFNPYQFEDYKEEVIELLQKVCWLSVETMKIVREL